MAEPTGRFDRSSVIVGAIAVVAGAVACVGATGPWVTVHLIRDTNVTIHGLNRHLDGYPTLALALAGIVAGLAAAVTRSSAAASRVAQVLVAVLGIVGLVVVLYEIRHLQHLDVVAGLVTLGDYPIDMFGLHSTAGWGLPVCGIAFGVMALTAVIGLIRLGSPIRIEGSRSSGAPASPIPGTPA